MMSIKLVHFVKAINLLPFFFNLNLLSSILFIPVEICVRVIA